MAGMPHFKFTFHDGSRGVMDVAALHLGNHDAAHARAEEMVRVLMSVTEHSEAAVWQDWRIEVRNHDGQVVATVPFMSKCSRSGNKGVS
jgi:hypothetical protein